VLKLKLPLVVGYLVAGVIYLLVAGDVREYLVLSLMPELGIALDFVSSGGLDFREIKSLGCRSLLDHWDKFLSQLLLASLSCWLPWFTQVERNLYMGLGLAFLQYCDH